MPVQQYTGGSPTRPAGSPDAWTSLKDEYNQYRHSLPANTRPVGMWSYFGNPIGGEMGAPVARSAMGGGGGPSVWEPPVNRKTGNLITDWRFATNTTGAPL